MSKTDVHVIVLEPMSRLYARPTRTTGTIESALAEYAEQLADIPADDLREGWSGIVRTWTRSTWPTIGEIRTACDSNRTIKRDEDSVAVDFDVVNTETDEYVESFILGTLGRQAASEDWLDALRRYIRRIAHVQSQMLYRLRRGKRSTREQWWRDIFQYDEAEAAGEISVSLPTKEYAEMRAAGRRLEPYSWEIKGAVRAAGRPPARERSAPVYLRDGPADSDPRPLAERAPASERPAGA